MRNDSNVCIVFKWFQRKPKRGGLPGCLQFVDFSKRSPERLAFVKFRPPYSTPSSETCPGVALVGNLQHSH